VLHVAARGLNMIRTDKEISSMSQIALKSLMFTALSLAAVSGFAADTGEFSGSTAVVFASPTAGGSTGELSFSFTRSDGSDMWNPGRVTVLAEDGSKLFELNDLGNVQVVDYTLDLSAYGLGQFHVRYGYAVTTFTVASETYTFYVYAVDSGDTHDSQYALTLLAKAPSYSDPSGGLVWLANTNIFGSWGIVIDD
jgi:hypothetical protein